MLFTVVSLRREAIKNSESCRRVVAGGRGRYPPTLVSRPGVEAWGRGELVAMGVGADEAKRPKKTEDTPALQQAA